MKKWEPMPKELLDALKQHPYAEKRTDEEIAFDIKCEIVEKIDETRDEYFNNMRFKPIDITFSVDKSIGVFSDTRLKGGSIEAKMVVSDELIKQLKGGETMIKSVKFEAPPLTMQLNLEGLTQEQLDSIKKQIEVFEKENEKPKDVIDYENGWVINEVNFSPAMTVTKIDAYTRTCYALGLYRDTKEECEKLIKKMKIEHRLRQWAKMCKDKVNWSNQNQDKYFACYDCSLNKINLHAVVYNKSNNVYFTDKSILQKAIADIGEQKLIDEYFIEI